MKQSPIDTTPASAARGRQPARMWISFVGAVLLLTAIGGLAFQHYRSVQTQGATVANTTGALSGSTEAVLNSLKAPVEIRFYSLLDPASTPESLRAFAERVNALLAEYERAGNGNIHVVRYDELTDANSDAAASDGIRSFNRDQGQASYLGIAAVRDGQKESLPEISPEWEQALESDLSRVVAHVNEMRAAGATAANVSDGDLKTARTAIESNPNLASASLEQGTQMLRDAALAEFKAAVAEMQSRSKEAEQRLNQGANSETDVAKEIEKIRAEQTGKIQEITARLHNQLAALAQSKTASH